ncbi:uncharacterized protein EI97DRAFT_185730 [Westerdykella ornata]|uniref:Uncharacterized protein n=1 Tax=Westerdykella ornata TaxID=318751 RepID=A0A6A6JSZ7_WESOR|nr:uncharacterized protein EI97DRAFT_185730 [Westerdykella ornata]KAF2279730.1 hypothetical protein EI97DRAFT_185730 [Westerdykella ornata]
MDPRPTLPNLYCPSCKNSLLRRAGITDCHARSGPSAKPPDDLNVRADYERKALNLKQAVPKAPISERREQHVDRRGKESRRRHKVASNMAPWPPRSQAYQDEQQNPDEGQVVTTKADDQSSAATSSEHAASGKAEGPSDSFQALQDRCSPSEAPGEMQDNKMSTVVVVVEPTTEVDSPESNVRHNGEGASQVPLTVTSPRVTPRNVARTNQPMRVSKPQKRRNIQKPMTASLTALPSSSYAQVFEQHIDSLRVSYYAESVRLEHRYGVEAKFREEKIAELQDRLKECRNRIQVLEQNEIDRRVVIKNEQEKVVRLHNYVNGLFRDHTKFKETTRAHQENWSGLREKIAELEQEKVTLERDFGDTITVLERSRKVTSHLLNDVYTKLKVSEIERIRLLDMLRVQNAVMEQERGRCAELEQQLKSLFQSVESRLANDYCSLLERVGKIQDTLEDRSAGDERAVYLKEVTECLHQFKNTPLPSKSDMEGTERMLSALREMVDSKLTVLSQLVHDTGCARQDTQNDLHTEIRRLREDILKFEEVNSQLQKSQQHNEHLQQQIASEKEKHERRIERIEELNANNLTLEKANEQIRSQLEAWQTEAEENRKLPTRDQLQQQNNELRQQCEDAQQRVKSVALELEEQQSLRQQRDQELTDLKVAISF